MITVAEASRRLHDANPVVDPAALLQAAPTLLLDTIEKGRASMATVTDTPQRTTPPPQPKRPRRAVAAAGLATLLVIMAIGAAIWMGGSEDDVAPTSTTVGTVDLSATEDLVAQFHAAYNAGDPNGAEGLLSTTLRQLSTGNSAYWTGTLAEQIQAECYVHPSYPNLLGCVERYTDTLHGPAGLSAEAHYLYSERDGELQQIRDDTWAPGAFSGCIGGKCFDRYRDFEADLYAWLEGAHPDVAVQVGDVGALSYVGGSDAAVAAVLPFVGEFVAQSTTWGTDGGSPPASGRDPLEVAMARYQVMSSHDAGQYEIEFGEAPSEVAEWFWNLGTDWNAECRAEGPEQVRCTVEVTDEVYTAVGAVQRYEEVHIVRDGMIISTSEVSAEMSAWMWQEFEYDLGEWMRNSYPDDFTTAFGTGAQMYRNGEAAAVVRSHIDEFLVTNDAYPREPEVVQS